jgi:[ribosomal protein S18]-alanine N-acetyltransferase
MSLIIARGGIDDLPAIMPVMTGAFSPRYGEAWTEAQCLGVLAMPGSDLIVARDNGAIGFALSRTIIDECELMLLAVAPASQQIGVGRELLSAMIANAEAAGARSVFLEVRQGNPAIALYSSAHFCEVGRRRSYYRGTDGEIFDALTYRLALS